MRTYELISGTLFGLIAVLQLTRAILAFPVQIGQMSIPPWASVVVGLVCACLSIWAFRSSSTTTTAH